MILAKYVNLIKIIHILFEVDKQELNYWFNHFVAFIFPFTERRFIISVTYV